MSPYTALRKANPRMWRIWYRMCGRCNNNETHYRDIKVCDDWNIDISSDLGFINFVTDMEAGYQDDLELDRINTRGDYDAHNLRWTTRSANMNNLRYHSTERGRWMIHARKTWGNTATTKVRFLYRVRRGWSLEDAASVPPFGKPSHKKSTK